jgi:hypothetical protein
VNGKVVSGFKGNIVGCRLRNAYPRPLLNLELFFGQLQLGKSNGRVYDGGYSSSSSYPIEAFSKTELPFPILFLLALELVIFGGWLNSYGIDGARFIPTADGFLWLSDWSPACGFLLCFLLIFAN